MRNCDVLRKALKDDLKVQEHMLTSDMTLAAAESLWLQNSFWKKFQDEVGEDADSACLKLFKESNEKCRTFVLAPETFQEECLVGEVRSLWQDILGNGPEDNITLSDVLDNGGVGPGANVGARSYNLYTKLYDSPLSCTSERLYRYYRYAILSDPASFNAEVKREKRFGHQIVLGNRLSFVPKTSEISRSICTEPTLNMYLQKGIGFALTKQLKRIYRIDLSRQPDRNRRLACQGSLDGDFCTIDLSSASDSIGLKMLQEILPPELLGWLNLARSPAVIFPDNSLNELYMVSSMGNGFTFPLETLLFSTIVVACYRVLGITPKHERDGPLNWGVFGDDIIVRKDSYDFVIRALKLFGFTPNDQKSFNSGYFRESCGGDYWRGHDIRGVYCNTLKTGADIYSVINRLIRWSARSGVLLLSTITVLRGWVEFLPIPFSDGDAEGIKTPYPPTELKRDPATQGIVYFALTKRPVSIRMPVSSDQRLFFRHRKRRKEIFYNANGLMVAFMAGVIRNGRIGVQQDSETFKIRRRTTSSWSRVKVDLGLRNRIDELILRKHSLVEVGLPVGLSALESDWEVAFDFHFLIGV